MTRLTRLCRAVGVGLAVATATLAMTQAAEAAPAPPVPGNLVPPTGTAFLVGHAKGVQIYKCDGATSGPSTPRADLIDDAGNLIVKHSRGPRWTATADPARSPQRDRQRRPRCAPRDSKALLHRSC